MVEQIREEQGARIAMEREIMELSQQIQKLIIELRAAKEALAVKERQNSQRSLKSKRRNWQIRRRKCSSLRKRWENLLGEQVQSLLLYSLFLVQIEPRINIDTNLYDI